jgi:pimeloyl-ACP methyl ester carboxylesterase
VSVRPDPASAAATEARARPLAAAFDVAGPEDAPPIVFIHGTRLCRTSWSPQMDDLQREFRVIALDLPGHGALAHERFTLQAARDQVLSVVEAAAGGQAVLVGLSLGGYVAMDVAAARPDAVRGLVVCGATAEPVGARAIPYRALARALERFDGGRLDALNAWFFRTRFPPVVAKPIVDGGFWSSGGGEALRAVAGERFRPRLAAYPGPTLIVNGEYDLAFRLSAGSFAAAARDARRVRIAGATHLVNLDRPRAFDHAIRTFMGSLDRPSGSTAGGTGIALANRAPVAR